MKPQHEKILAGVLIVVALVALLIVRNLPEKGAVPEGVATTTQRSAGMTLTIVSDPATVFKKAFWRRPQAEDQILHAERREWSPEAGGVRKWQWFIEVSPGPQMLEWLKTNPFSLAQTQSPGGFEKLPAWFPSPSGDFQIQQNAERHFTLMLSADQKHLYATDSGTGFGSPEDAP